MGSSGIPVSMGMDRDSVKLANSQIGFIQFIVKRLYELYTQLIGSKEAKICLDTLLENEKYWIEEKKKQTTYKIAKKPYLDTIKENKDKEAGDHDEKQMADEQESEQ